MSGSVETGSSSANTRPQIGPCPLCGEKLIFTERLLVGEVTRCEHCRSEIEVARLRPLAFGPLAKID